MSYIITGAQLLTYNHQNNFLSDSFRLNSTKNYTVEGFFLQSTNTQGVSGNLALESGMVRSLKERENIIVNGLDLGPARITSISFNKNNPIRLDTYTISFNVLTSGANDLYNLTGNLYTGINTSLSGTTSLLEAFEETLNFNIDETDNYNYTHNLNIRYRKADGYASPIVLAKNLASGIFNSLPNLGFIDSKYSGLYTKTGKKYFTENYNLITNDCSFTKNFNIFNNNYSGAYSLELTQSFNFGNDGNIDVTEQANIKGLAEDRFTTAKNAVDIELAKSYTRCNTIFNNYKNSNQLTNSYSLLNTGIEITKNYNAFNGEAQYSIKYTNNPVFNSLGYTKDTTLTLNQNNFGIIDVQENGNIRIYGNKSANFASTFDLAKINTIFSTAASNVSSFYTAQGYSNALVLTEKNLSFPVYGQVLSYNLKYSDDKIYNPGIAGITKLSIKKSDSIPKHMYNQYIIPNKTVFIYAGGQTDLGERNVTLECTVARPNGSIYNINPVTSVLNTLKSKAVSEIASDFPNIDVNDAFVTKCDYSFNSDLNLNFNLGVSYTTPISAFNNEIKAL